MGRRWLLGIGITVVVVIAVLAALFVSRAPAVSSVGVSEQACIRAEDSCLRFPAISGENLSGEAFQLPADFAGALTLVIVPFDEGQQVNASRWLPLARELAASVADFAYYNVPVFPGMSAPLRAIIRTGMTLTIGDAALRNLTITAFLDDRDAFLAELGILSVDATQVFLLKDIGNVVWRGAGEFSEAQAESLRTALAG